LPSLVLVLVLPLVLDISIFETGFTPGNSWAPLW
jgi:hypothetical protein